MTGRSSMYRDISAAELPRVSVAMTSRSCSTSASPTEVAEWAISGAVNVPVGELPRRVGELPDDREIVVVCASGSRSALAADLLAHRACGSRTCGAGWRRGVRCTTGSSPSSTATCGSCRSVAAARDACPTSSAPATRRSSSTRRSTSTCTAKSRPSTAGRSRGSSTHISTPTMSPAHARSQSAAAQRCT